MTIIVEDGNGVPNANSYVSVDEFKAWATSMGHMIPSDETQLESLLLKAMAYIEYNPNHYCGTQVYPYHKFPRSGLTVNGFPVPADSIPKEVKLAQMQLGVDAVIEDLMANRSGAAVTKEKVDVIEVNYAAPETGGYALGTKFTQAEAYLGALYCDGLSGLPIRTKRA